MCWGRRTHCLGSTLEVVAAPRFRESYMELRFLAKVWLWSRRLGPVPSGPVGL